MSVYSTTLFLYTERIQTDSERALQLSEVLDGFEEKQQESSIFYNSYISTITQAAAMLVSKNPEFMKTAKLEELSNVVGAERVLIYDNSASVIASNRNYNGITLSEDPDSMSYGFRWVLRGEPLLVQDLPDEEYLGIPYRYSGASMMDEEGNYTGMVQLAMDPALFEKMESMHSLKTILEAFAPEDNSLVLAVEKETGRVMSPGDEFEGETAESLGLTEEILQDDYTGFFHLKKNRMIGSCQSCGSFYVIVALPTENIPSSGLRYGILTALPGILAEWVFFLILLFYIKSCRKMEEEEILALQRERKRETNEAREQIHAFSCRAFVLLCSIVALIFIFRMSLFEKGTLGYYIFIVQWARGIHIFSITRCLIYVTVAVFVLTITSKLLTAFSSITISRQETFIRLGLSFFKYGVGIAVVYICASTLGAPAASLLASAGILSVVLSFGAQNVVADIISGLFIVFEGTFKVGDMITVDDWHGQVVEIGIRNTKILDLISEDVKIMNNSTIRTIINFSERPCWSPIQVGVDYDTDIPKLEAAFEREKAAMKKKIPLGIGEIVYLGIDELSDSQMTLKFQMLCRNQDQLRVKRALNREIRLMFARNNITIPFPQVTLSSREDPEEGMNTNETDL